MYPIIKRTLRNAAVIVFWAIVLAAATYDKNKVRILSMLNIPDKSEFRKITKPEIVVRWTDVSGNDTTILYKPAP